MALTSDGVDKERTSAETIKNGMIEEILSEDDVRTCQSSEPSHLLTSLKLYRVIGASRSSTAAEIRRSYLERSKICHPDKPPHHPQSTRRVLPSEQGSSTRLTLFSAFQRLGFAFEILKSPSSRRSYDKAFQYTYSPRPTDDANFLGAEHTFRGAVEAILHEFMTGDFVLVRKGLESLNRQYPNLVSPEVVFTIERSFIRIRELVLTTRTYALLIYIELGRIHRVQKRLMGLGYLDVLGRVRLTVHLVRVTLAVPIRVDRALKHREENKLRAKAAGMQASGITLPAASNRAGILNEKVTQVLEFIVGEAGRDDEADEAWNVKMASASG